MTLNAADAPFSISNSDEDARAREENRMMKRWKVMVSAATAAVVVADLCCFANEAKQRYNMLSTPLRLRLVHCSAAFAIAVAAAAVSIQTIAETQ